MNRLELTDDELETVQNLVRSDYLWWWERSRHARLVLDRERASQALVRLTPLCTKLNLEVPRS